jgi:hypothetical protein
VINGNTETVVIYCTDVHEYRYSFMVGVEDTYKQQTELLFERCWDEEFVGVVHGRDELPMVELLFFQCDELFECSVGKHDGKTFVCCLKAFEVVVFFGLDWWPVLWFFVGIGL